MLCLQFGRKKISMHTKIIWNIGKILLIYNQSYNVKQIINHHYFSRLADIRSVNLKFIFISSVKEDQKIKETIYRDDIITLSCHRQV